ncbi:MAG: hypothetical protein AABX19_01920 [Nanoarchaeota archaeon]
MKEEYEIKFWKDWLKGDNSKRLKLVKNLSIIREVKELNNLPEEFRERMLVTSLNGFFEDLEAAVYTKIRLENKKSKNGK